MSPRDSILAAVRKNLPAGPHPLPELANFAVAEPDGRVAGFVRSLKQMGGQMLEHPADSDPMQALTDRLANARVVCSAAPEVAGNRDLATVEHPADLADVDIAVVRAAFAVAETGSVLFTEAELQVNAVAYLAQHLIVLIDPADIVSSTQEAYRRPEFYSANYAVFHTGPSATADIEGVLIHGAQGVRSLTVVLLPRPSCSARDRAGFDHPA